MITYVDGDLFQSPAKVLVNTVNTVGIMGKGIAQDFKRLYPDMFRQYQRLCENKQLSIGQLWLYKTPQKWILNFPTKVNWRQKSKPEYIEKGLQKFVATYDQKSINSISFPLLGCGNGELDWEKEVRPLMERYLKKLPISIYIHVYKKGIIVPEHQNIKAIHAGLQEEPQNLAFIEFWDDLKTVLNSKSKFRTLDTNAVFHATLDAQNDGIRISPENQKAIFIAKEEDGLLDLWQYIRTARYCVPDKLPLGLDIHAPYVIALLAELDYLTPVRLSLTNNYEEQIGLQLIPKTLKKVAEVDSQATIIARE